MIGRLLVLQAAHPAVGAGLVHHFTYRAHAWRRVDHTLASLTRFAYADPDERAREILGLICQGAGDAAMARALNLSPHTVRNHVASLYRKLGVNRRSAVVIWARERGFDPAASRRRGSEK